MTEEIIQPERFASIPEAQERASFQILAPRELPPTASLTLVAYNLLPHDNPEPRGWDSVILFYETEDGRPIAICQGYTGFPMVTEETPSDATAKVSIHGKDGYWVDGFQDKGGWERGLLALCWQPTTDRESTLPWVYNINVRSDHFTLQDVLAIAESVPD